MLSTTRNRIGVSFALALALMVSTVRPSEAFLDKTRFVAHLGVAYFCFHHWVQHPFQAGAFQKGAPHRTATIVKGGAALLFAVHEVQVSEKIARKSKSPLLHKLDGKLVALAASFAAVGTALKHGQFKPSDVTGLQNSTEDVNADARAAGTPIKDVPIPDVGSKPSGAAGDDSDSGSDSDSSSSMPSDSGT